MPRALVTGITGQDGFYLAELLLSKGYDVFGLLRGQNNPKAERLTRDLPRVEFVSGDLIDAASLLGAVKFADADEVYNLGACSLVPYSWTNPKMVADVNGV